jgi:hypothetical protein
MRVRVIVSRALWTVHARSDPVGLVSREVSLLREMPGRRRGVVLARDGEEDQQQMVDAGRRVSDGIRTRDRRDHNPELYQLSYAHQGRAPI